MRMPFPTEKKNQLAKQDKSKKGDIDEKILLLLETINAYPDYYTTSSCSGRVVLWRGSGKKNETEWIKITHNFVVHDFYKISKDNENLEEKNKGVIWLRLEPMILHVACKDLQSAKALLDLAKPLFKKSCLLSIRNKIIIEIRGSEGIEMPLYRGGRLLFPEEELPWLTELLNEKMKKIWEKKEEMRKILNKLEKN